MHMKRLAAAAGAALLTALAVPADAHAAAIACGGAVSTQNIGAQGCISAERFKDGKIWWRDIKAHAVITNSRAHASYVDYEAFMNVQGSSSWTKLGNGRTVVQRRSTIGPFEIGSATRICGPVNAKITIRVHVRPAGGAWSNWSSAATSQCQT
ncbi:hypothetical protein AB0L71_02050 [Streptomyces sp. NPDC052052]|uniref:hypothetical protein n=1 Tax=Streptomyces sp. NPDC052052 TaxID=3154756 RepID=UPI00342CD218